MAMLKYAASQVERCGSLNDVLADMDPTYRERALSKVASFMPVSRVLEDYIYVRSWAVSAGEIYGANDNLDYFPGDELKRSYATFINTGFYKDHANSNVKLAYGLNLDAVYTPKDFVAVISAVKKANLQPDQEWFASQIKSGKLDQVSMGCQVEESTCSNCGNKATNVGDYCGCLQHARMSRSASASGFCQDCQAPAGGCLHIREAKKLGIAFDSIAKTSTINGHPLYEINRGCTFFDLSGITTVAADRLARIAEVIDKQASSALFDFIRPSLTVQTEGGSKVDNLTGGTQMANLDKTAAENKNPQLKNQVEGGNPTEMTDAGDYDQKAGNPEALQEKAQKAQSAAPKKEHEIRERGQHDAGDYGAEANPKTLHNDESHDAYSKTEAKGVDAYRADAAKGVTGLGKEAQSNDSFVTELKGFFRGLMDKKAETVAAPVVNKGVDLRGLDEVRASLRDDLESLQEATDKLHDEKLKLVAKKAMASISMVQKRAQGEIDTIDALDKEIAGAKDMVEGTLTEMRDVLEGASAKGGVGMEQVASLKSASLEIRAEVDKVLDKAVIIVAAKSIIPVKKVVADVKPNVGKVQERQPMTDAGDYDLAKDPYKALDANNKATANATQTAIEKQNETLTGKPEDWVAYRKLNALTRQFVAEGKTLKEAKAMAKGKLEATASETKRAAALKRVADTDGLKAQIVDRVSDKLVNEIFEADPANPKNVQAAEAIASGAESNNAEAKAMFSSDVKPALTATKKAAKEDGGNETYPGAAAIKGDSEQEPSSPYWDLFPEDNISSVCSEANKEMSSRSKETMKETTASVASTQPLFSNKVAYERAESQQSLAGSDSLVRILEAISLADKEVNAGLVDEAQMEEEAKRLFISTPDELRATSKVVAKVAKKVGFKSPVPDGYMKQAVSMGEGASASASNEMALFDNDGEGLY